MATTLSNQQPVMPNLCVYCEKFKKEKLGKSKNSPTTQIAVNSDPDESVDTMLHHTVLSKHLECLTALLDDGADINHVSKDSDLTPLMHAVQRDYIDVMNLLIARGAQINLQDKYGKTALWYAAADGHIQCLNILLTAGGEFRSKDKNTQQTPLAAATWSYNLDCMDALIEHGATFDLFKQEANSWLVFGIVVSRLPSDKARSILEKMIQQEGALPFNIFLDVAYKKYKKSSEKNLLRWLIESDVTIRPCDGGKAVNYNEALHCAIESSNIPTLNVLLENKFKLAINVNRCFGLDKRTLLQKACDQLNPVLTDVLLEQGADVDAIGHKTSRPPVFMVLRTLAYDKTGLTKMASLIKYGCNLNRKFPMNLQGNGVPTAVDVTPLEYALCGHNLYAARMLCTAGVHDYDNSHSHLKPHKTLVHKALECTSADQDSFVSECLPLGPLSLFALCRPVIVKTLGAFHAAQRKIQELPLPDNVKEFLAFSDLDEIAQEFEERMTEQKIRNPDQLEDSQSESEGESESAYSDSDAYDDSDDYVSSGSEDESTNNELDESDDDFDPLHHDPDDEMEDDAYSACNFNSLFKDSSQGLLYDAQRVLSRLDKLN